MSENTTVKIGLAQMPTVDDLQQNLHTAAAYVKEAAEHGADIVCLPARLTIRLEGAPADGIDGVAG